MGDCKEIFYKLSIGCSSWSKWPSSYFNIPRITTIDHIYFWDFDQKPGKMKFRTFIYVFLAEHGIIFVATLRIVCLTIYDILYPSLPLSLSHTHLCQDGVPTVLTNWPTKPDIVASAKYNSEWLPTWLNVVYQPTIIFNQIRSNCYVVKTTIYVILCIRQWQPWK